MKIPRCPHCNKKVIGSFGLVAQASTRYYPSRSITGWLVFNRYIEHQDLLSRLKKKAYWLPKSLPNRNEVIGYYCRFCNKMWSKEFIKEIVKYYKLKDILSNFGKHENI